MVATRRALVRVDASPGLGYGHLMRTLCLSDELTRRGWCVTFACHGPDRAVEATIARHGYAILPLTAAGEAEVDEIAQLTPTGKASRKPFDWVILDHFALGRAWLKKARRRLARRCLVVDDLADRELPCDLVVNADPTSPRGRYANLAPKAVSLSGPRFALMRREYIALHEAAALRRFGAVNTVVVSFGGSDPVGLTRPTVRAVAEVLPDSRLIVVLGPGYQHDPREVAGRLREVVRDPVDLPRIVLGADLGVGGAGATIWEWCAVGLPSIVVAAVENQVPNARWIDRSGAGRSAGGPESVNEPSFTGTLAAVAADPRLREQMSEAGRARVDGRGTVRVADQMEGVRVRRARSADERLLWRWVNDPATRTNSLSEDPIPLATHRAWFRKRLNDMDTVLLIGENGGGPIGQVRFDLAEREATVSISVAPERRGGTGGLLLGSALAHLAGRHDVDRLRALVKPDNHASMQIFLHAGFVVNASDDKVVELRRPLWPRAQTQGK